MKNFGKTKNEVDAEKTLQCRQIVQEILNFGVNENQKVKIIQLLSLELENRDFMNEVVTLTKDYLNDTYTSKVNKKLITIDE
mgnify:CR=1 FL=1